MPHVCEYFHVSWIFVCPFVSKSIEDNFGEKKHDRRKFWREKNTIEEEKKPR